MGLNTFLQSSSNVDPLSLLQGVVSIKLDRYLVISSMHQYLWVNFSRVLLFDMFSSFKPFEGLGGPTQHIFIFIFEVHMDKRISTVPGDPIMVMSIGFLSIMEMKILPVHQRMEMKMKKMEIKKKFITSCLHSETNAIQLCPNCFLNSTVLIDSIDSKCILEKCIRYAVTIDSIDSKYILGKCIRSINLIDSTCIFVTLFSIK